MILLLHFRGRRQGSGGASGDNQWSSPHPWSALLVPSSCKNHLLIIHPNTQDYISRNENQYPCQWVYSFAGLENIGIPDSSHSFIAPCLPNPHTTVSLCLCPIQRERSYFLNFSRYYVNICEQINCECGFHLFPFPGPHISLPTHWGPVHLAEMSRCSAGWL